MQVYLNLYKSSIHPPQPRFTITLHPNYSIALWNIYNNISISKLNFLKLRKLFKPFAEQAIVEHIYTIDEPRVNNLRLEEQKT